MGEQQGKDVEKSFQPKKKFSQRESYSWRINNDVC